MKENDHLMSELIKLRKRVSELEQENQLCKDTEGKLQEANQQFLTSERQLRFKHETLEITQRIARVGSWEWDIATDTVSWSEEMFRIFKRNPAQGAVSYTDHPKIYTAESMQRLDAAVQHCLQTSEPYEIDLEIIRGDGTQAFCTAWGYARRNKKGEVIGLYGAFQDISQRKHVEEKLKKSEESLRAIVDHNPFPIAVVDEKDQSILFWSESAIQLFGHQPRTTEEWFQLAYPDPEYRQAVLDRWFPFLEMARKSKKAINTGEYEIRCKDGSTKIGVLYAQFIPGRLIVTLHDVTDKKQSEAELKKIEWLLKPKDKPKNSYTPDYGDLTNMNRRRVILDAVGKDVLNEVVSDYLSLLETSAAVYEKNGDYAVGIFSSDWCQFMDCSSRALCKSKSNTDALDSGKWLCHESCWTDASKQAIMGNKVVDIECNGGLHIYAMPIRANNEVIGCINIGYGNPPTDEARLKEIAANYQVPVEKLKQLAQKYETRPAFIIDIAKEKLATSAKLIGNIVERKQLELELVKNQRRYQKAQQLGHVGNWEFDLEKDKFWGSDEARKIYGFKPTPELMTTDLVESCIPDRERVHQALIDLINHNKKYDLVFDIITHDLGIRKTIHSVAEIERDAKGNPIKVTGVIIDITQQKKTETILKALNQQLAANEQQLKASYQQLQSSEQQLMASNEQLRANEQQLLASNQQLHANEQQLKAAVQQLQSREEQLQAVNQQLEAGEKELIAANKKLVHAIEKTEEDAAKVTAIIEGNLNSIWAFDRDYRILYVNRVMQQEFQQSFGVKLEPGVDLVEALPEPLRPFWKPRYDKVLSNEQFTVEDAVPTEIGTLYIEVSFNPIVKDGRVIGGSCFGSNITDRKLAELELIEAKEKAEKNELQLFAIIENSPMGFAMNKRSTGEVTYVNKAFADAYHIPLEYCSNVVSFFDYVYRDQEDLGNKILADVSSGDPERMKWELVPVRDKKTNHIHYVSASNIVLEKIDLVISTVIDITPQVQNEYDLIAAKERAEESDRLKSAFLANMSHEIRTPMNGILGFTDLLREPKLTGAEMERFISVIERSGNRLLNTVNDLVDFSKIDAGQMRISMTEVDVNELLEQLLNFFRVETETKGLQLHLDSSHAAQPMKLLADQSKLYSILTNLIKNAIKYTQHGKIEFGYQFSEDELQFFVKDTGFGIAKDKLEVIFERFVRCSDEEYFSEGSGLGLSISKAYVEMHGGKIWVESEKGKGSQFYFTLPYQRVRHQSQEEAQEVDAATKASAPINKLNILIAEDDEAADELLALILSPFSKKIMHTKSGARAVELCRSNPDLDLILMDINMPELNGYEATRQIREFNKKVIIIAQTAYALSGDRDKSLEAGCNGYIPKPINKVELLKLIDQFFNRRL